MRFSGESRVTCVHMVSSKTTTFFKSEDCPSSNELLEFQNGGLTGRDGAEVRRHLACCDFCAAELDLYSRYPQEDNGDERVEIARIPAPLFQLAEALLKKRHSDPTSLDSLLRENGLVFDNA
jgi:hypothetical protein